MPTLLNSPQVFSHTVFETLQFDQTLRELHMYTPPGQKEWKGCVEVFVGKKEWFKAWLKVEKDCMYKHNFLVTRMNILFN